MVISPDVDPVERQFISKIVKATVTAHARAMVEFLTHLRSDNKVKPYQGRYTYSVALNTILNANIVLVEDISAAVTSDDILNKRRIKIMADLIEVLVGHINIIIECNNAKKNNKN